MNYQHQTLASGKWFTMTLAEQMANIGSEVERTISWYKKGDKKYWQSAFDRALELIDLTVSDTRYKHRLKEILRTREVLCDLFYGNNTYHIKYPELQKYFLEFGIWARQDR